MGLHTTSEISLSGEIYAGFPKDLIAIVLCPRDAGTLKLVDHTDSDRAVDASVTCDSCGYVYQIQHGILRLLPGQTPLEPTVLNEQQARDVNAKRYDAHFQEWQNAAELSAILSNPTAVQGKLVLDLACGTGRLTRVFAARAGCTIAADLSEESLRILSGKVSAETRIGLIWGDAVQLRFVAGSFDIVLSTQLLEHIPSAEKRVRLLREIDSIIRPTGTLLLTVYYYSLLRRLLRRRQEGFHEGGIFYHRFTGAEMRRDLLEDFEIVNMYALQPDQRAISRLHLGSEWKKSGIGHRFLAALVGQLLFIEARKVSLAETDFSRNR